MGEVAFACVAGTALGTTRMRWKGVLLCLGLWTVIAPRHKTKSGEVPTPAQVWDAMVINDTPLGFTRLTFLNRNAPCCGRVTVTD